MKALKLKSILIAAIAAAGFAAGSAVAVPIADQFLGAYDFPNSGNPDVLIQFKQITGNDYVLDDLIRDNTPSATLDAGTGLWVLDDAPTGAGYFLLKFGIGNARTKLNTYFFKNTADLAQLVFSNSKVNFLSGGDCSAGRNDNSCEIGRLSHWVFVADDAGTGNPGGGEVPEPATLALLGAGLAGLAVRRRRA